MTLQLEFVRGQDFIAEVIRTKRRKTATVKVEEGKVSVVVPESLPDTRIEALVSQEDSLDSREVKNPREFHCRET